MRKKQVLFVTHHTDGFDEGFSYAVDLAKTLNADISVLMLYKRRAMEKFENAMTVVAFAEENDFKTARELISNDLKDGYEARINSMKKKCDESGLKMEINTADTDPLSAIRNLIRQDNSTEMIILSPGVTGDESVNSRQLNRLVKTSSRPVVIMSKNAFAA